MTERSKRFRPARAYCCSKACEPCKYVNKAIWYMRRKGLVVYPTDTVYGLGVKALDEVAVERVFEAKGRPGLVPLPIAVASRREVLDVANISKEQLRTLGKGRIMERPITWVLPAKDHLPELLLGGEDTIGVRILNKGCGHHMIKALGPITATSANTHGEDAPVEVHSAYYMLGDKVDVYMDCGLTPIRRPTTVVAIDLDDRAPDRYGVRIIREGAVSNEVIRTRLKLKKKGRRLVHEG